MAVTRPCDTWALGARADALTDKGYCRFCFTQACTYGVRDATLEHAAVLDVALALREQYQQTVPAHGFRRGQDFQPGDRIRCGGQDWIVAEYDGTLYMTERGIIDLDWRYSPVEHGCHYKVADVTTP